MFLAAQVLWAGPKVSAQDNTVDLGEALDSAQQWAEENLDPDALKALNSADQEKVKASVLAEQSIFFIGISGYGDQQCIRKSCLAPYLLGEPATPNIG